jgi:hypothetical protein
MSPDAPFSLTTRMGRLCVGLVVGSPLPVFLSSQVGPERACMENLTHLDGHAKANTKRRAEHTLSALSRQSPPGTASDVSNRCAWTSLSRTRWATILDHPLFQVSRFQRPSAWFCALPDIILAQARCIRYGMRTGAFCLAKPPLYSKR